MINLYFRHPLSACNLLVQHPPSFSDEFLGPSKMVFYNYYPDLTPDTTELSRWYDHVVFHANKMAHWQCSEFVRSDEFL